MHIELHSAQQLVDILKQHYDSLVVLDFYADWCGPCKRLGPILENYAETYSGVVLVKANADSDELDELTRHYKVQSLPTVIFFHQNNIVQNGVIAGFNERAIETLIKTHAN